MDVIVGAWFSGSAFAFRAADDSESPRTGRSTSLAGTPAELALPPSLRFGSSKGLTPRSGESRDAGECDNALSARSNNKLLSIGEAGDLDSALELLPDPVFRDFGASCNLKRPSFVSPSDRVSSSRGADRSLLSWAVAIEGEAVAEPDAGVLLSDVILVFPLS